MASPVFSTDEIYILEMKYERCSRNASADKKRQLLEKGVSEAFKQISEKNYAAAYTSG
jgi:hypothetical protein